jgi:hypothetical protein
VWPLAGYDQWHDAQETKREQAARAREDAGLARVDDANDPMQRR